MLWRPPPREVALAWKQGIRFFETARQPIVGVLSDPGQDQRLTLIPWGEGTVVKIGVGGSSDDVIDRERACLTRLQHTRWRDAAPSLHGTRNAPGDRERAVLLMERVRGRHPRWDDSDVHVELLGLLRQEPGAPAESFPTPGLFHGDVAPWNVLQSDAGRLVILDWESAQLSETADPLCGVLDFILRGAVAARARVARCCAAVKVAIGASGGSPEEHEVLLVYRRYRERVRATARGRPDALGERSQRLLAQVLPKAVGA
jgi:hypothetical protein